MSSSVLLLKLQLNMAMNTHGTSYYSWCLPYQSLNKNVKMLRASTQFNLFYSLMLPL